ncbi:alpha/beta hydrolase [Glaciecola sp. MH2013]|uniref:alpha/beta fold hydrolase n=1 Tax=Glaciecola sp. MH2013 TaxID=2785524 RepID=UPI00189FF16D|nr:alpha/beta hydrolase [Glaciecola sp. MH2013]MBF7072336.1 alpha/beta hydrolase [Glaciecola sp. MH2013]
MPHSNIESYKNKARYLRVGEHNIAYWAEFANNAAKESTAKAKTVLFIHGFPSASWDWHWQWEFLQKQAKSNINLVCFDLLGLGLSDKPSPYSYSLVEQANIADTLLNHLNIKDCLIVAHDYGDSVAQSLLTRFENHQTSFSIQGICYLNGGLFAESHRPLFTQKLLKSKLGPFISKFMSKATLSRSFNKIFGPKTPPSRAEVDVIWALLEHNNGTAALPYLLSYIDERHVFRNDWVEAMKNTQVPQLFINGIYDPISGQHMLDKFKTLLPAAKAIGIDVGHYPQLEAPDQLNQLLTGFVNQ